MAEHLNPDIGILTIPLTGACVAKNQRMRRPREILAENLRTLMAATPHLSRLPKIVEASNGALSNGTLDRIRRAESATSVDNLEALADLFGLEAWQLLVPDLRAEETGIGQHPHVYNLPWPFDMVESSRYLQLHEPARAYVQAKMNAAIEEREQSPRSRTRTEELAESALLHPRRTGGITQMRGRKGK